MKTSPTIAKVSKALLAAQKNIGSATKGNANPFFKSKYADLGSVMEACKDALNAEGIAVIQPVSSDGTSHFVETVLLHESGEFISDTMKLELGKTDMQQLGSAVTYARRYGLQSMLFIPAEDDDGEATMQRAKVASAAKSATMSATTTAAAPATKTLDTPASAPAKTAGFRPGRQIAASAAAVTSSTPLPAGTKVGGGW